MAQTDNYVDIEVVNGVEGPSLCINGYRVAGPKPWGGGHVITTWRVKAANLREYLKRAMHGVRKTCNVPDGGSDGVHESCVRRSTGA